MNAEAVLSFLDENAFRIFRRFPNGAISTFIRRKKKEEIIRAASAKRK
jgi:hypothetical protein